MPADDPGLEFEEDLEDERPAPRSTAAGAARRGPAPAKGRKPGAGQPASGRKRPSKRGGLGARKPRRRGKTAAPERERPQVTVRVIGLDRSFQVEEGTDLLRACKDNHVNVFWGPLAQAFNCRGVAACGLCQVQVVEGADHLAPPTKKEAKRLKGKPDDWRLACHARLTGDVRIDPFPRIPIDQQVGEEAIRRALLTEEAREELRQNAKATRQAEREAAKGTPSAPKERKGLLARLQKGNDDDGTGRTKEGKADRKAKDKGKAATQKGFLAKAKPKGKKAREGDSAAADDAGGATDGEAKGNDAGRGGDASRKRSFGLKGRK